jgi:hypothetical protein
MPAYYWLEIDAANKEKEEGGFGRKAEGSTQKAQC